MSISSSTTTTTTTTAATATTQLSRTAWIILLLSAGGCRGKQHSPPPLPWNRQPFLGDVTSLRRETSAKTTNATEKKQTPPPLRKNGNGPPIVRRRRKRRRVHRVLRALRPRRPHPLESTTSTTTTKTKTKTKTSPPPSIMRKKYQMYLTCFAIIFSWFALGTLFYSKYNHWPLPQSFFYAVDAGMSIGFCTQVAETKIGSRAFTIVYILLGASFIGGALAHMVQNIIEGAASRSSALYRHILEEDAWKKRFFEGGANGERRKRGSGGTATTTTTTMEAEGTLSYEEFRLVVEEFGCDLSDGAFAAVCEIYDPDRRGYVDYDHFSKTYQGIDRILLPRNASFARRLWDGLRTTVFHEENRIFLWFVSWVGLGVAYGMKSQKWDFITATHFAVSALATGGLTAPPVDEHGILPAEPAIFCGLYCIFGVPLFAMTLGQFASVLIESYLVEEEHAAIIRPLSESEYEFASKSLCTNDDAVHLSDFIVLQLMRQGKMTVESLQFMKRQFELCDRDGSGKLSWREATQLADKIR